MRSLYGTSGLGRTALGLLAWPRALLRRNARASDTDDETLSLLATRNWRESRGLSTSGAAASVFAETPDAGFTGLTAEVRTPTPAAVEAVVTNPVVILGHVPSTVTPNIFGSSTVPAVAQICGCGY